MQVAEPTGDVVQGKKLESVISQEAFKSYRVFFPVFFFSFSVKQILIYSIAVYCLS